MEEIELEFRDLKSQFETIEECIPEDEEWMSLKELTVFQEKMLEYIFDLTQLIRTLLFRIETLERSAKIGDLTKVISDAKEEGDTANSIVSSLFT